MLILGVSFVINFPDLINWNFFIVGIAFFYYGFYDRKVCFKVSNFFKFKYMNKRVF